MPLELQGCGIFSGPIFGWLTVVSGSILLCCVASLAIWLASVLAIEKGRNESGWLIIFGSFLVAIYRLLLVAYFCLLSLNGAVCEHLEDFPLSGAIPFMNVAARSDLSGTEGLKHFTLAPARFSILAKYTIFCWTPRTYVCTKIIFAVSRICFYFALSAQEYC